MMCRGTKSIVQAHSNTHTLPKYYLTNYYFSPFLPDYSPPALRLRAAQRAGGHDTTLKKLNRTREDPDPLPQQQLFSVSRKFLFVSFRFVFFPVEFHGRLERKRHRSCGDFLVRPNVYMCGIRFRGDHSGRTRGLRLL